MGGEPDPKFVLVPVYLVATSLVAFAGIVLTIVRSEGAAARMIFAVLAGGAWLLFAATLLSMLVDPNARGFE